MHEETPEETAEKFAKRISDLIDEERLAFEKAASVHKEGATIARNRPLAQDWFRASASLLAQFREQSRLGLTPEVPIEAIDRLANLAKHFADGREHPVAAAARDNERGVLARRTAWFGSGRILCACGKGRRSQRPFLQQDHSRGIWC